MLNPALFAQEHPPVVQALVVPEYSQPLCKLKQSLFFLLHEGDVILSLPSNENNSISLRHIFHINGTGKLV